MEDQYVIVGTSHVSKDSLNKIKHVFAEFNPDIIGIELDRQRYQGMVSDQKTKAPGISTIRQLGITGYLFALIGRLLQKKIGNLVGINPGSEMMLGAQLAKKNKLPLALIDQDVRITLKNLSKKVKAREKWKIVWDVIKAPFSKKEKVKFDLSKIPSNELINRLMEELKKGYPGFYKVLVDDRNRFMAKQAFMIMKQNPDKKLMLIVGAGHDEGMNKYLKSLIDSNILGGQQNSAQLNSKAA